MQGGRASGLAGLLAGLVVVAGCSAPVGVKRISPREEHRQLTRTALVSAEPSDATQIILRRYNLVELYDDDPPTALAKLRQVAVDGRGGSDELFALAELSYLYAEASGSRADALAAALYAYAFLFPEDPAERPQAIDRRYRWACDLYAEGLTEAFATGPRRTLVLQSGVYPLPWGTLAVAFDAAQLAWSGRQLTDFVPVAEYQVQGLRNRYRQPGIGVPLAARTEAVSGTADDFVEDRVRVPATLVLRLDDPRHQVVSEALAGQLDLYTALDRDEIEIGAQTLPLEVDRTGTVATTLAESAFWQQELASFLGDAIGTRAPAKLTAREPYRPGRMPVVFVHGTNSSPGRWADMVNDLENDRRVRERYQFWFFRYDSGNPIAYSAMLLRRALRAAVARFDPDGRDPCLRQMVVIGHSQGGLLTKMTVIDSESRLWDQMSRMPFDQVRLSADSRALVEEALFVEPLPFVTRVVFIATPHRGSYLAGPSIVRRLAARFIRLPGDLTRLGADLVAVRDPAKRLTSLEYFPTSIDNMSPGNAFIETLSGIPVAPGVAAHSIIPVDDDGPLDAAGDGVVAYSSAHIEGVESERIIRPSSHSTQSNPDTIDEVRRILLAHADDNACARPAPADRSADQPGSP